MSSREQEDDLLCQIQMSKTHPRPRRPPLPLSKQVDLKFMAGYDPAARAPEVCQVNRPALEDGRAGIKVYFLPDYQHLYEEYAEIFLDFFSSNIVKFNKKF